MVLAECIIRAGAPAGAERVPSSHGHITESPTRPGQAGIALRPDRHPGGAQRVTGRRAEHPQAGVAVAGDAHETGAEEGVPLPVGTAAQRQRRSGGGLSASTSASGAEAGEGRSQRAEGRRKGSAPPRRWPPGAGAAHGGGYGRFPVV